MEVIPVLDIKEGVAVSGKAGERSKYIPLKTVYSGSSNPLAIAETLPYKRLYVADLDGIMHGRPDYPLLEELCRRKKAMVDAGMRSYADVRRLAELSCELVIGTETLESLGVLRRSIEKHGDRVLLSLDIKNSRVVSGFLSRRVSEAAEALVEAGVRRIIVLNISAVGTLGGVDYALIKSLIKAFPGVEFMVGGGVRREDLGKLKKIGVRAVLVGTALHQGRLKA